MNSNLYKYPRTFHLPWSEGISSDDKVLKDLSHFIGKEVVVTEKLDGENTSVYTNYCHARSLDSVNHSSRNWIKNYVSNFNYLLPEGFRICGENLYAKHSIYYDSLESYFYLFSVWDNETCLSWDETLEWCEMLKLKSAPELYRGVFDEVLIKSLFNGKSVLGGNQEGYVVRLVDKFEIVDFSKYVAKFVRKNHVKTDSHWMNSEITLNKIK